jgi:hypothetical protein
MGWNWVHLVRRPLTALLYQPRMIEDDECGAVGGMRIGRGNRSTWRKPSSMPLCPPQVPYDLTWALTRAAALGTRRLTAWAMAQPKSDNNWLKPDGFDVSTVWELWRQTTRRSIVVCAVNVGPWSLLTASSEFSYFLSSLTSRRSSLSTRRQESHSVLRQIETALWFAESCVILWFCFIWVYFFFCGLFYNDVSNNIL